MKVQERVFCPCNGRCHEEEHPCSFVCMSHHRQFKDLNVTSLEIHIPSPEHVNWCPECRLLWCRGEMY